MKKHAYIILFIMLTTTSYAEDYSECNRSIGSAFGGHVVLTSKNGIELHNVQDFPGEKPTRNPDQAMDQVLVQRSQPFSGSYREIYNNVIHDSKSERVLKFQFINKTWTSENNQMKDTTYVGKELIFNFDEEGKCHVAQIQDVVYPNDKVWAPRTLDIDVKECQNLNEYFSAHPRLNACKVLTVGSESYHELKRKNKTLASSTDIELNDDINYSKGFTLQQANIAANECTDKTVISDARKKLGPSISRTEFSKLKPVPYDFTAGYEMQYLFYADVLPMTKLAMMNDRCEKLAWKYQLDLRKPKQDSHTGQSKISTAAAAK